MFHAYLRTSVVFLGYMVSLDEGWSSGAESWFRLLGGWGISPYVEALANQNRKMCLPNQMGRQARQKTQKKKASQCCPAERTENTASRSFATEIHHLGGAVQHRR